MKTLSLTLINYLAAITASPSHQNVRRSRLIDFFSNMPPLFPYKKEANNSFSHRA
jgi:hypothetical protein